MTWFTLDASWMLSPVLLVVNTLAAVSFTRLWLVDSLPPLPRVRHYLQQRLGDRPLVYLVVCGWCSGFWIALGVTLLACTGSWWLFVAVPMAMRMVIGWTAERE